MTHLEKGALPEALPQLDRPVDLFVGIVLITSSCSTLNDAIYWMQVVYVLLSLILLWNTIYTCV